MGNVNWFPRNGFWWLVSIAVVASIIILTITFIKKQLSILIKQKK